MKRFLMLALMASVILGAVSMASAVEVKVKGEYKMALRWMDNTNFFDSDQDGNSEDDFGARQRFRMQMDFIASESLKGVFYIESGETVWGGGGSVGKGSGGAIGADGVSIEVKRAYIEFLVPNTALTFKVGIQGVALPDAMGMGSPLLDDDLAGIVASYKISDMVSLAGFWLRPYDTEGDIKGDSPAAEELDAFGLIAPLNFDGVKLTPYFVYATSGKDLGTTNFTSTTAPTEDVTAWWVGASFEVTALDPLVLGVDAVYGASDAGEDDEDRAGFYIQAELDYKMDVVTPGILAWYSTGDDDDLDDGSETFPALTGYFYPSTFAFDGYGILSGGDILSDNSRGTMGVGLLLKDISFIEDLTHTLRVIYVRGTHDEDAVKSGNIVGNDAGLSTEDSAWVVEFDHEYKIYDQLSLAAEMGYISLNLDEDVWGTDETSDAWKLAFQLKYKF